MIQPSSPPTSFSHSGRSILIVAAVVGALLSALVGVIALNRPGAALVSLAYDLPFVIHRAGGADSVRVVYLNQTSGDALDRRPHPALLDQLRVAGAKMVVYDLIFDQPSADPAVDEAFSAAIRRFRGVDDSGNPMPEVPQRHVLLACGRKSIQIAGAAGEQLVPPIDLLLDAADDFGVVACDDESYSIRKLPVGTRDEPSITWKAAVLAGAPLLESTRMQPRWLNYAGPPSSSGTPETSPPIFTCPVTSLLDGGINPEIFRDKIVVIGGEPGIVGAALGQDLFATPFHRVRFGSKLPLMSGVEIQANALANLLQGNWLLRTGRQFDFLLVITSGALLGAGFCLLRPSRAIACGALATTAFATAGVISMHSFGRWFPWTVPAFAQIPVAVVWGVASRFQIERFFRLKLTAERRALREAFAKYLSPQMLDRLTGSEFRVNLGGENVQAAMMFTDIESFTDMCERVRDPQRIVETLNHYFERTTQSIFDHDGVIIKYIGDAIYAVWGAPLIDPDAPVKAARAAWQLSQNDLLVVDGHTHKTRIGLHFGEVVSGNVGSSRRVDYTLIGDAVNLAARLEGLNKMFGTHVLISREVHDRISDEFLCRRIGKFQVKGRREVTEVFELLGPIATTAPPAWLAPYHFALQTLESSTPNSALPLFQAIDRQQLPQGDGPSRFWIDRITANAVTNGIATMKEK